MLTLMFVACHPLLSPEAQVALTLRVIGGLTSDEIARAFLVSTATVQAPDHPGKEEAIPELARAARLCRNARERAVLEHKLGEITNRGPREPGRSK